jgi:hypothetical protein
MDDATSWRASGFENRRQLLTELRQPIADDLLPATLTWCRINLWCACCLSRFQGLPAAVLAVEMGCQLPQATCGPGAGGRLALADTTCAAEPVATALAGTAQRLPRPGILPAMMGPLGQGAG